jgi:hypothetical protein
MQGEIKGKIRVAKKCPFSDFRANFFFELNRKGYEPSQAENTSARAMAQASLA